MAITLSETAINQIAKQLKKRGKGLGLRLSVRTAGCSGLAYVIDYADEIGNNDQVFEQDGVRLIVSENDLPYLDGIQVDYTREGINQAFRFNNPNAKGECGCGESFTI